MKIRDSPDKGYPAPAPASTPVAVLFSAGSMVIFYSGPWFCRHGFFFSQNKNDYKSEYSYSLTFSIQGPERLLTPPLDLLFRTKRMAELKNIRIAVSGIYDYALEEIPTLRIPSPGRGAPDWVEEKRLYKVYRPAAVLAVACPKFANLPMTHHHPKAPVDGQNFRDLAIGWTGEHPEVDYIAETDEVGIRSTCVLYDDEALNAYQNGEIQLSPGYIADFEWQKGTTQDGQEYDIIMKEITDVNHLALLPNGRGGEYAVVMDQAPQRRTVFDVAKSNNLFDVARRRLWAQK